MSNPTAVRQKMIRLANEKCQVERQSYQAEANLQAIKESNIMLGAVQDEKSCGIRTENDGLNTVKRHPCMTP